jgi:hypothetical protein
MPCLLGALSYQDQVQLANLAHLSINILLLDLAALLLHCSHHPAHLLLLLLHLLHVLLPPPAAAPVAAPMQEIPHPCGRWYQTAGTSQRMT